MGSDEESGRSADRARAAGVDPAAATAVAGRNEVGEEELAAAGASENGSERGSRITRPPRRDELSSIDDMRVTRDRHGEIEPLRAWTVMEGHAIEFIPITYRDRNRYGLDQRGLLALDEEERVEFLSEHVVSPPEFAELSEPDDLDDFGYDTIDDILFTIARYSRDMRRNRLPRPMDETDEDGAAGKGEWE